MCVLSKCIAVKPTWRQGQESAAYPSLLRGGGVCEGTAGQSTQTQLCTATHRNHTKFMSRPPQEPSTSSGFLVSNPVLKKIFSSKDQPFHTEQFCSMLRSHKCDRSILKLETRQLPASTVVQTDCAVAFFRWCNEGHI